MFKRINDKINVSFTSDVPKSADDIMNLLKDKAKDYKWYSFFMTEQIDYKEFKFHNNEIEISRMPGTLWPCRAFGKIKLTLLEQSPTETKVKCEVMTGNNAVPILLTLQTAVLLLWSAGWIAFGKNLDLPTKFGIPILALTIFNGILILKVCSDRRSLIDYSKTIIKLIKE